MFVGHALVAFGIVAGFLHWTGSSRDHVLLAGALAGAFATLPDVDMLYAVTGLVGASGVFEAANAFWATGNVVHRTVTHSLVLGSVVALGVGCWRHESRVTTAVASLLFGSVVAMTTAVSGPLAGAIALVVVAGAVALTEGARSFGLSAASTGGVAAVGLLSHPFGDLLTGEPPAMLYPLDVQLVGERIALHTDPTLHLLGAFWVELATAWLALGVLLAVTDRRFRDLLSARAGLGGAYAAAAFVLPAPTLDTSYHFVFSVLAVGAVGATPRPFDRSLPSGFEIFATGLTAVSLAGLAYGVAYLLV